MKNQRLSFKQAFDLVKFRRDQINPNDGFIQQLEKWEAALKNS
jgi:hypothetical protein